MAAAARLGSFQFDPLEVAGRNHDLVLSPGSPGTARAWTDALLYERARSCTRPTTRACQPRPHGRAALVPRRLGPPPPQPRGTPRSTSTPRWSRSSSSGSEPADRCPRPTSSRGRRSTGTGGRRTRCAPSSRRLPRPASWAWPGATATGASTTWRSGSSRPSCSPSGRPSEEQLRHKLLSRYRAHGLLGRTGSAELWLGTGMAHADGSKDAVAPAAGSCTRARSSGALVPVAVDGLKGERFTWRRGAWLDAAAAEVGEASPGSMPATTEPRPRGGDPGPDLAPAAPAASRDLLAPLDPVRLGSRLHSGGCSTSTTSGRSTSRERSGAGATTSCRSCSATGSWAGSSRASTARPGPCAILGLWWEEGFDPLAAPGFVDGLADALDAHRRFAGMERVVLPRFARRRDVGGDGSAAPRGAPPDVDPPRREDARPRGDARPRRGPARPAGTGRWQAREMPFRPTAGGCQA